MADDDSDGDLFDEPTDGTDVLAGAALFGVLNLLDEEAASDEPLDAAAISALLAGDPTVLAISGRSLGDADAAVLASAMTTHPSIKELHLSRNFIRDEGVVALAGVLPGALPQLEMLDVSHNAVCSAVSARALACALPSSLTALDLSGNALGDDGVAALAAALAGHGALAKLYLDRCSLADRGLAEFARCMVVRAGTLPRLYELWLSNNGIGDEGATALFGAFESGALASLGDLRLQFNDLGDVSMAALARALRAGALANVWYLGLGDNAFSEEGLQTLGDSLTAGALPRLEFVTAAGRAVSDAAATQLVQDALTHRPRGPR